MPADAIGSRVVSRPCRMPKTTRWRSPRKIAATAIAAATILAGVGCAYAQDVHESRDGEPIIGGPCEGCEAVFQGLPAGLTANARIAPEEEPGEPMRVEGTVYDQSGRPAAGVIVYAYHTDAHGIYPPDEAMRGRAAYRHGRLRGWVQTDAQGRYRFDTVRPGGYPNSRTPTHVHMHVIEVDRCTYYISSIHFEDDPRLTPEQRDELTAGRGGRGLVRPTRDDDGVWVVTRDIRLGAGVPGYPSNEGRECPSAPDSGGRRHPLDNDRFR